MHSDHSVWVYIKNTDLTVGYPRYAKFQFRYHIFFNKPISSRLVKMITLIAFFIYKNMIHQGLVSYNFYKILTIRPNFFKRFSRSFLKSPSFFPLHLWKMILNIACFLNNFFRSMPTILYVCCKS